jgi:hypothetical protein
MKKPINSLLKFINNALYDINRKENSRILSHMLVDYR